MSRAHKVGKSDHAVLKKQIEDAKLNINDLLKLAKDMKQQAEEINKMLKQMIEAKEKAACDQLVFDNEFPLDPLFGNDLFL